jgi:hypothetical protein
VIQETEQRNAGTATALPDRLAPIGWKPIAFFIAVPIILGTWATFENWWLLETAGLQNALIFYIGHALLPWWLTCLMTALVMRLLARWRPNQIVIMLLGVSLALFLSIPYGEWLESVFVTDAITSAHGGAEAQRVSDSRFARFWSYLLQPAILWVGINLIFDRLLDFPRYRYDVPQAIATSEVSPAEDVPGTSDIPEEPAAPAPRFLQHLDDPPDADDVYAIKAEQHYIRLYTPTQDYMVLYRFSDAVAELGSATGLQVHRSYWVRNTAIEGIRRDAKKMFLQLKSGLEVPVSQPYQALVRQTTEALERD